MLETLPSQIQQGCHHILAVIADTADEAMTDNVPRLAAALALYCLLSLAPLLVVIIAVASFAFGEKAARGELAWQIQGLVGSLAARTIQALIQQAYTPATGMIATIAGVLTVAWGASSVAVELREALNTIWHVTTIGTSRFSQILWFLSDRMYAFVLVLGAGFLLLVSLLLSTVIAALGQFLSPSLSVPEPTLQAAEAIISFIIITFLFAAIYKIVPRVTLRWADVLIGAAFTSLVFNIGKQLVGLYLGKAAIASPYGAAGSLVLTLVWIYYSAQLFLVGAEFTKVYARRFGSHAVAGAD
jgi:membrane protein